MADKKRTVKDIVTELDNKVFQGLQEGTIEIKVAAEMNNTAGKIAKFIGEQLEYAKIRKEKPQIDYLKCN
ncbi:MAG: hypothetical protein ACYS1A_19095 [Planctomycetota bacterium]